MINLFKNVTVLTTGTENFKVQDATNADCLFVGVRLQGTVTLTGNYNLAITGTPVLNQQVLVINESVVTLSTNHVYIAGTQVPDELAGKLYTAECIYNGSAWEVIISPSFSETSIIATAQIKDLAITNAKINDVDGSKIAATSVTAAKIANNTITATQIAASTITATELANNAVTSTKILANAVTLAKLATQADATVLGNNSGGTAVPTALTKVDLRSIITYVAPQTVLTVPVSFETGEQADNTITIPFACTLVSTYVSAYATHAIAGTNNATITLEKNGVAITGGLITFTASAAINTAGTVTAFSVVSFAAGDTLNLVSAKVTAGGKAIVSIPLVLI